MSNVQHKQNEYKLKLATPADINALTENNEGRLSKALYDVIAGMEETSVVDDDLFIIDQIPTHWDNGTGYLDHGVNDPQIPSGIQVIGLTQDNRLVHVTNTPVGNVVLFDRYSFGKHGVVVSNMPNYIKNMYGSLMRGQLSDQSIDNTVRFNLGKVLFDMVNYCKGLK